MGEVDANGYEGQLHAYGPDPAPYDTETVTTEPTQQIRLHWGSKGIDEATSLTSAQRSSLKAAAATSQAAFDSTASALAGWYDSFGDDAGLTSAEEQACRERLRWVWSR